MAAPSPKKASATLPLPSTLLDSAAPVAIGIDEPMMPDSPRLPTLKSARCSEPPLPPHTPSDLPTSSAISGPSGEPLPIGWPWLRWLPDMKSWSPNAMLAPTTCASWPMLVCTVPGMWPRLTILDARSSK